MDRRDLVCEQMTRPKSGGGWIAERKLTLLCRVFRSGTHRSQYWQSEAEEDETEQNCFHSRSATEQYTV